jgi:AraC-like DNA-binding protein
MPPQNSTNPRFSFVYRLRFHLPFLRKWRREKGSAAINFYIYAEKFTDLASVTHIESVSQYNTLRGIETLHPLVTIVDFSRARPLPGGTYNFGLYAVYMKELKCGELKYGRGHYDYQEGTLVCTAPGQVVGVPEPDPSVMPKGWAMLFHPDLIKGTSLGRHIDEYTFFSYEVNEALHVSDKEKQILLDCMHKIQYELGQSIDTHSKKLITANIELFLGYCTRFYDRQFLTRDTANKGILEQFEQLLKQYFASDKPHLLGLPSVSYCASELHLSANYFVDLIRKETGKNAQEYIRSKLIDLAKERVLHIDKSISEVAYDLGFKYPQHFTRLFKQKTGVTPNAYRSIN